MYGRKPVKRIVLTAAGFLSLALGVTGIFLPLLPTTPFLLLSAACFIRSSDRLYRWLTGHRFLGNYIKYYMDYRAITLKSKIVSLAGLWIVISLSAFLVIDQLWIRLLLFFIATAVSLHILAIKTVTKEMMEREEPEKK